MAVKKPTPSANATTQVFTEIDEIQDDVLLMKDYSAVTIIEVGAVNFWLLSEEEQASMIYAFGNLLNSLSFPVQILIVSKKMDISSYLEYLTTKTSTQTDPLVKDQLLKYEEFIKNIVKKTTVLEKRFFFAVPFTPLELGIEGAKGKNLDKQYVITRAKASLYPKRDNLVRLLLKTGLKAVPLQKQGIVELLYNLYNPSATGMQLSTVESYTDVVLTHQ